MTHVPRAIVPLDSSSATRRGPRAAYIHVARVAGAARHPHASLLDGPSRAIASCMASASAAPSASVARTMHWPCGRAPSWTTATRRWAVEVEGSDEPIRVKPRNLVLVVPAALQKNTKLLLRVQHTALLLVQVVLTIKQANQVILMVWLLQMAVMQVQVRRVVQMRAVLVVQQRVVTQT